ncbi:MAG: phytanoyl-CoA dioxygenase family protein [Pseudomonadota bacterium]
MVQGLNADQLRFFKHEGYLIVRKVLDDALCDAALDLLWSHLPPSVPLQRDVPESWQAPFHDAAISRNEGHLRVGDQWRLREVSDHPVLIRLMYSDVLVAMGESLLGKGMVHVPDMTSEEPGDNHTGIRGIYNTLPQSDPGESERPLPGFHTDGHPFHVGLVAFLDDVPPDGGGFQVWAGSHRLLYPTFIMQYDQPRIESYDHLPSFKGIWHTQAYRHAVPELLKTKPVDCFGRRGDVIFWHHRVGHAGGYNYAGRIRHAVLADYSHKNLDLQRKSPPKGNMWEDWSPELQNL